MFLRDGRRPRKVSIAFIYPLFLASLSKGLRIHESNFAQNGTNGDPIPLAERHAAVIDVSSPDDHLVTDPLPLMKDGSQFTTRHWAGHLPASGDGHKYFFYWLFEPETVDDGTPLLIWLNGGPGCSSMEGLFLENGPIQWTLVNGSNLMLQQNPYSWHNAPAYTLYIDQPVGTGLSFTTNRGYPTNDEKVNVDFYYFLTSFFDLHAEKFVEDDSVNRPVFFSGESHAGHYIPSMMNFILKQNTKNKELTIPLSGAAIGNGWIDPIYQYAAAEAAYGHGLLGLAQVDALAISEKKCQDLLNQGNYRSDICLGLLDEIVDKSFGLIAPFHVSQYDVRVSERKGSPRSFPKGHRAIECYLGGIQIPKWESGDMDCQVHQPVLETLHATAAQNAYHVYKECAKPPYSALAHQDGKGVVDDIVEVLQHPSKPRLLFFNGVQDLVCNHVGNEKALENLPWAGRTQWIEAPRYAWISSHDKGKPAGFMKEFQNLLFLKVLDAGHMVPMDQPDKSLEMMAIFMRGASFSDSLQDISSSSVAPPVSCPVCATCPAQEDCPTICPHDETGESRDCSAEVARAKQNVTDNYEKPGTRGTSGIWAVPMVALLFVLGAVIWWRQKREGRELVTPTIEHVEDIAQSQYHDEPSQEEDGEKDGNGII